MHTIGPQFVPELPYSARRIGQHSCGCLRSREATHGIEDFRSSKTHRLTLEWTTHVE